MSDRYTVPAALLACLLGLLIGWGARRRLATLRRGAVVAAGWIEVPSALISGLGVLLTWTSGRWPLVLWIGLLAVPLTAVDLKHHRLPDAITLPAIPVTLAVVGVTELMAPATGSWWGAVSGLLLGGAFYALALASPKAMGRGAGRCVPGVPDRFGDRRGRGGVPEAADVIGDRVRALHAGGLLAGAGGAAAGSLAHPRRSLAAFTSRK